MTTPSSDTEGRATADIEARLREIGRGSAPSSYASDLIAAADRLRDLEEVAKLARAYREVVEHECCACDHDEAGATCTCIGMRDVGEGRAALFAALSRLERQKEGPR